jgi:DNA-binding NarL/FixJ family response regulator
VPGRIRTRGRGRKRPPRGKPSSGRRSSLIASGVRPRALVAAGASAADAALPARAAHAIAQRLGARPLQQEIQQLAQRARLELAPPSQPTDHGSGLEELLGLTPREAEVLGLVARGYTNRQIAEQLVISVKTASVHVSHILAKLDARNRVEAAAIAHRLAPATPAAPGELPG